MSKVTSKMVLDIARSWLGLNEADGSFRQILSVYNAHKPLARGTSIRSTQEWCAAFVSALFIKAGAPELIGTEISCYYFIEIFKSKGIWIEDGTITPMVGDIILYDWNKTVQPNDGTPDHIGIVEKVIGNTITAIEGNKGEKVDRRQLPVGHGCIRGYARPAYHVEYSVPTKTVTEIAMEVIKGEWGSGEDRKKSLINAGYSATAVQAEVNRILSGREPSLKSLDEVAKEVIAGKWGNGFMRKTNLTKAGYNYDAVQNRVSQLMKK